MRLFLVTGLTTLIETFLCHIVANLQTLLSFTFISHKANPFVLCQTSPFITSLRRWRPRNAIDVGANDVQMTPLLLFTM